MQEQGRVKSEKLRDFKTQEKILYGVWNAGIQSIGIMLESSPPSRLIIARLHRASVKERKTRGRGRCFLSREITLLLQHSRGNDSVVSFIPNAVTNFLSSVLVSLTFPTKKLCSKRGLNEVSGGIYIAHYRLFSFCRHLQLNGIEGYFEHCVKRIFVDGRRLERIS